MPLLKRDDVDLYYELAGQGPPVLLIQGVGAIGGAWRYQVNALKSDFETLIFDNRGIGKSVPCRGGISIEQMAQDARSIMDELHWDSAHVVGHSMGGVIAQQLAFDCPKRVRSLSLLCTFARGKDGVRVTPWVLWMTLRTRIGSRRMRRRAFLEMLVAKDELRSADLDEMAVQFGMLLGRDLADQPPVLMKQVQAVRAHDCSARLRELEAIPTLIVSAERDPIALPRFGRTLAGAIPNSRFEELKGASHGVIIHRPDELNRKLREFLQGVERERMSDRKEAIP